MTIKSSVILVTWNSCEYIGECLDSLLTQNVPRKQYEIIIVDNGSQDGTVEFLHDKYAGLKIFVNEINNYSSANNLGFKKSSGNYISFLNPDTRVEQDWLNKMIRTLDEHPKAGVVTSKIYENKPVLYSVGMNQIDGLDWVPIGNSEEDRGQYDGVYKVSYINHCSCLYRRKCLDEVGLLDEDFMMYHEDVDMSLRVKRAGWHLMVNSESIVHHQVHGSIIKSRHLFNYFIDRNRLFVIAKHYPRQFGNYFACSRFYRYHYKDDSGDSLQRDLCKMLDKWLKAREYSLNLPKEISIILRNIKEHSHNRLDQFEVDLKLKSEGLVKSVCKLELELDAVRKELGKIKKVL